MRTGDPRPRGDQVVPDAVPAELDALVRVGERFGRTVR